MKLTLGFSPCPNDTFIFDALVNGKVDTGYIELDVVMDDVQALNEWAQQGRLDVSKISYGALPLLTGQYGVLSAGGALGKGVGPLLISGDDLQYLSPAECREKVQQTPVAIPGQNTTAHFLFSQAFPGSEKKVFLRFDEVEEWVLSGNGIGVIIHENRFTYAQKGLHLVADLGSIWEQQTGLPIPLGGIVAKRTLPQQVVQGINNAIQKSLTLAWEKYPELSDFVRSNAQEMQEHVMREHIQLYVNDFSMDMQQSGRRAIMRMMEVMAGKKLSKEESIFL